MLLDYHLPKAAALPVNLPVTREAQCVVPFFFLLLLQILHPCFTILLPGDLERASPFVSSVFIEHLLHVRARLS